MGRKAPLPGIGIRDVRIQIYNGVPLVATKTLTIPSGSYAFMQSSLPFTMTTAYTRVVVIIEYNAASGTVWFDDAPLVWDP